MTYDNKKKYTTMQKAWIIFKVYFKSMIFAFTGGSVTMPIIRQQLGEHYGLLDEDEILELFALGQALPGTISINTGVLIGRTIAGFPGAIAATLGSVLPAFVGMLFIAITYNYISKYTWIQKFINGVRAASVAVIFFNAIEILKTVKYKWEIIIAVFSFIALVFFHIHILVVVLVSGLLGIILTLVKKRRSVK